jgi:hypothetical protein
MIAAAAFANGIALRPFPGVRGQAGLVEVEIEACYRSHSGCFALETRLEDYQALREAATGLEGIAASTLAPVAAALPDAQPLSAALVTATYFDVLGTKAVVGRTFAAAEEDLAHAGVAVIAHRQSEVHTPGGLNPAAIAGPAAILIAVMLAASAIPAARAGRVNLLEC